MQNQIAITAAQADEAVRLFAEHGYHGAALDRVGAALGLTPEQIYARAGGRNGLLLSLLHHCRDRLNNRQGPFLHSASPLLDLERWLARLAAARDAQDLPAPFLILDTVGVAGVQDMVLNAAIQSYLAQIRAMLSDIVRRAIQAGVLIDGVDCDAAGDFLFGALLGLRALQRIDAAPLAARHYVSGVMHYLQRLKRDTAASPIAATHSLA
jgi:AcrR family transcriptional regulator